MNIQTFADKYSINDLDNFKQDMLDYFAKSNEFKSKRDEVMKTFDELQKKMQDAIDGISKTSKPSKSILGPFASKAAKNYAEENGIDPSSITGTGSNDKDGNPKITKSDLIKITKPTKETKKKKENKSVPKGCNGVLASGESCTKGGNYEINERWYCGFHKDQGQNTQSEPEAVDSEDELDYNTENENESENENENEFPDELPIEQVKDKVILKTEEISKPKKRIIKKKI